MGSSRLKTRRGRFGLLAVLALLLAAVLVATVLVVGWLVTGRTSSVPYAGPALYPAPQHISGDGAALDFSGKVTLVMDETTDGAARTALDTLVREVAREVATTTSAPQGDASAAGTVVYLGTQHSGGGPLEDALRGVRSAADDGSRTAALGRPEGYVVATGTVSGRPTAVLAGADPPGTFYAVQSLRRLLDGGRLAAVSVADWPLMGTRGVIEGFYGFPWSSEARSAVLDAMARSKMNTFVYSPKDDPYLRARWRDPYPDDAIGEIRDLVAAGQRNHIDVAYALSPGLDICYSRASDLDTAAAKIASVHALGIRQFVIPLDDIGGGLTCPEDRSRFTAGGSAGLAQAQAWFLNRLRDRLEADLPGLAPLQMVPTEYSGAETSRYKSRLGRDLDARIIVQWTGEEIVSHRITSASASAARNTYGAPGKARSILVWDNFPVNDFAQDRLFLSAVEERDGDLYKSLVGMVSNPMIQPYASLPGIATYADMTWNGPAYDPAASLDAALADLAGGDADALAALRAFTDLNQNWQLDYHPHPAPALSQDVDAFWSAYRSGRTTPAGLAERARLLERVPQLLTHLRQPGYATDVAAWSAAAAHYGTAIASAVRMLGAVHDGDAGAADAARSATLAARDAAVVRAQPTLDRGTVVAVTGDGVVQQFLDEALKEYANAFGG
ncbi:beta-N-acetylglucosaminidase domain-containing protein [Sinomonas sp. R1AF57]|uniref:beta-N-acetylhexosaminidase family protein n=1 Tax=Sinomonas sp. R1AF57 TaxID=2020377 RepID=UPI000B60C43D|nr:beta-N-acetylglucosaminidase domain-containing protein [Sinomonas sp. R1AF57]ASN53590.1 hypothetical protein CGQ25_17110 [Sinomonas sp. R1AF57]